MLRGSGTRTRSVAGAVSDPGAYPPAKQRLVFGLGPFLHGYAWWVIDSVPYDGERVNIANARPG